MPDTRQLHLRLAELQHMRAAYAASRRTFLSGYVDILIGELQREIADAPKGAGSKTY